MLLKVTTWFLLGDFIPKFILAKKFHKFTVHTYVYIS